MAVADTPDTPANNSFKQSLLNDLAWMLVAHRKLDAARQIATAQLSAPGSDAHYILLMVARLQGDWNGANQQAIAIRDAKPISGTQDGTWLAKLLLTSLPAPAINRRITLLMIDSERALGHAAVADKLVADMRQSVPDWEKRSPTKKKLVQDARDGSLVVAGAAADTAGY